VTGGAADSKGAESQRALARYVPWLFLLTLGVILVGQGTGVVRANTLAFRIMHAAPIMVVAAWLTLRASGHLMVRLQQRSTPLERMATYTWSLLLIVVAAVLAYFAMRVVGGS
jgi:hypothetical protein